MVEPGILRLKGVLRGIVTKVTDLTLDCRRKKNLWFLPERHREPRWNQSTEDMAQELGSRYLQLQIDYSATIETMIGRLADEYEGFFSTGPVGPIELALNKRECRTLLREPQNLGVIARSAAPPTGDVVVHFQTCSTPFLLRPGSEDRFCFLGPLDLPDGVYRGFWPLSNEPFEMFSLV